MASRRRWREALGLAVLAGFVAWAWFSTDKAALGRALLGANPWLLLLAAASNVGALALQAMRWRALLAPVGHVRRRVAFAGLILGFGLSAVLPARLGEVARVRLVAASAGVASAAVAGSIVLDHVVNAIALMPVLALLASRGELPAWARQGARWLVVAAALVAGLSWVAAKRAERLGGATGLRARLAEVREGFLAIRAPGPLLRSIGWGVVAWAGEGATAWLALEAFGLHLGWAAMAVVLVAVNLALAAPAGPANAGTFELGAVLALSGLGFPAEAALAFAIGYHAVQLVSLAAAVGAVWPIVRR